MTAVVEFAPGVVTTPGADPYPNDMEIITDPAKLPADRAAIPGDTLINPQVWAKLQGVQLGTVYSVYAKSGKRRAAGEPKAGDMPAAEETIGQTPMWSMATYRAWDESRPGRGAGAGRPPVRPEGFVRHRVELPISCPHCKHEITKTDLDAAKAAKDGQPTKGAAAVPKRQRTVKAS
jgi:hypothetical protein